MLTLLKDGEEVITTISKTRIVLDEDGEPVMRTKYWKEYVIYHDSVNTGKVLISVGGRDMINGCRPDLVKSEEFYIWANYFDITNLLTKSEGESLILVESGL